MTDIESEKSIDGLLKNYDTFSCKAIINYNADKTIFGLVALKHFSLVK